MTRPHLTPFESSAHLTWRALRRELVGFAAYGLFVSCAITDWPVVLERIGLKAPHTELQSGGDVAAARFLAPFRHSAPPPREEHIEFVGLGEGMGNTAPSTPPVHDGVRPTTVIEGAARGAETEVSTAAPADVPRPLSDVEVDSVAVMDSDGGGPVYPPAMLKMRIEGTVLAQFVVDSSGHADVSTFRVLQNTDPEFIASVKSALPRMKFRPALLNGRRVPQLVELPFSFVIKPAGDARS
jgi:protein TonB